MLVRAYAAISYRLKRFFFCVAKMGQKSQKLIAHSLAHCKCEIAMAFMIVSDLNRLAQVELVHLYYKFSMTILNVYSVNECKNKLK